HTHGSLSSSVSWVHFTVREINKKLEGGFSNRSSVQNPNVHGPILWQPKDTESDRRRWGKIRRPIKFQLRRSFGGSTLPFITIERWRKKRRRPNDFDTIVLGHHGPDQSLKLPFFCEQTPAAIVKAKMKLQLAETAAEDDAALVKHIGQSFRFSAIEARREEQIKAAHDEAMFGASAVPPSVSSDSEPEPDSSEKKSSDGDIATSLFSENVLAKQQGSWRDRFRKA
ncbi:hypothetical protein CICLE_v10023573mg, partial [Citrus x clementina]